MEGMANKSEIAVLDNEKCDAEELFRNDVYEKRLPVILRNFNIGPCIEKWTPEYLANKLGEQLVKIHVCTTEKMDFINKNFLYKSLQFSELVKRASEKCHTNYFLSDTEHYYLRSLGEDPRRDVADIRKQFPVLEQDVKFPSCYPEERFFSSVFRISSADTCLWTHYDIMDNCLIQITGRKRCVLFPPTDVLNLYLIGDKSEVLDIDNPDMKEFPNFRNVNWHECILQPGDILFIPALWFHNMTALDFSVALNVFWKHLEENFYDKKDIYGNKDLTLATNAFTLLQKALKCIDELPSEYKTFYSQRMIAMIQKNVHCLSE